MAFVYDNDKKEYDQEESIKVEDKGKEVRELDKCKVQLTDQKEILKNQEGDQRVVEKIKRRWSRMGKTILLQNRKRPKKRRKELKKKGKTERN